MNLAKLLVNLFQFNRTNWKAVSLCFLAAAVFWLFNAFNKSYSTEIRFPLQVAYNENRFIPVGNLPTELRLNVNGNGWDLFRKSLGVSLPELIVNIERPLEIKQIAGTALPPLLANQLGGLVINHVVNDTLRMQFDERDVHTFILEPDLTDVWFREGFGRISPIVVLPDSVKLEGPRTILHRMADVVKVKLPKLTLDENYRGEIQIELPDSLKIKLTPPSVTVMFEVGRMETLSLQLPVELVNRPTSLKKIKADSTMVLFRVAKIHRTRLEAELKQLAARVDLKNKSRGAQKVLPVVSQLPEGVELAAIDSVEVQF
jgi:hypothetical protein